MKQFILLLLSLFVFCSCSEEKKLLNKFVKRFNAKEYDSAAEYVHPRYLPQLTFFIREIRAKCPEASLRVKECEVEKKQGGRSLLKVKIQWENASPVLQCYFGQIGRPLDAGGCFSDSIWVLKDGDAKKLAFNWGITSHPDTGFGIASIKNDGVNSMNIRRRASKASPIVAKMPQKGKILINQATSTDKWYHGFWVDKSGQIRDGYIYRPSLTVTTDDFFRLDGEKAWYPWIAAALLGGLIVFMRKGSYSWIWTFCLSLLFIFTLYQALERLLFNVMLLNLPG